MFEKHAALLDSWIAEHCSVDALNARLQGERRAVALLDGCKGRPDAATFRAFCEAWNLECFDRAGVRREITCTRFGPGLAAGLRLAEACDGGAFPDWLERFWNAELADDAALPELFDRFRLLGCSGAGPFVFSLLLYLREPEQRFPWSRTLVRGMVALRGASDMPSLFSMADYAQYCGQCRELREYSNVLPQEVDFLLMRAAALPGSCSDVR